MCQKVELPKGLQGLVDKMGERLQIASNPEVEGEYLVSMVLPSGKSHIARTPIKFDPEECEDEGKACLRIVAEFLLFTGEVVEARNKGTEFPGTQTDGLTTRDPAKAKELGLFQVLGDESEVEGEG